MKITTIVKWANNGYISKRAHGSIFIPLTTVQWNILINDKLKKKVPNVILKTLETDVTQL